MKIQAFKYAYIVARYKKEIVSHSRRANFNVTVATFNTDVLALQNGTEVARGSTEITYYNTIIVGAEGKVHTKFKAIGAANAEIGFLYKVISLVALE